MRVEDWLGIDNKLSIDIWQKKYRFNNETFDEWLDRVSGGDTELKQIIKERKFLFGGRTLANRNTGKAGSYSNCFVKGTKIITKRGLINIEDVNIGDEVITEDGSWQKVNSIMNRDYSGDLYKISAIGLYDDIICTPNHQFLTQNGWLRADRLLGGYPNGRINSPDKLRIPTFNYPYKKYKINFTEHYENSDVKRIVNTDDNKSYLEAYVKNKGDIYTWVKRGNEVNTEVEADSDFYYFIGVWLGDGSVTRTHNNIYPSILQIVFNQTTEKEQANKIIEIGTKYFGIKPNVRYTKQNVISVRWNSEIIGSWFLGEFGEKCDGKYIPDKYIGNIDMAFGLMDSDGSVSTHGAFKIVLKNEKLITWLRDTLFLNGYPCQQIHKLERQDGAFEFLMSSYIFNQRIQGKIFKTSWDYRNNNKPEIKDLYKDYINITDIEVLENQNCNVYNLSVENNHTYTANGVVVHNCYSRGFVEDNLEDLMQAATDIAQTFKAQGGQGISLSKVRPKGSPINHGQFKSDGIVPFMEIYNRVTESISQGGSRKGALLMSLDIWHKEAEEFIKIKSEDGRIQKANLSLEIDDEFMECIQKYYETGEEITKTIKREYGGSIIEYEVTPIKLYKLMMEKAWDWGEPGCILTNQFRNYNLMEFVDEYQIENCNPCGEQPLVKHGACNLGSINLSEFVHNQFTEEAYFDCEDFVNCVRIAVIALDKVLDENKDNHALPQQKEMAVKYRNIGLGVTGAYDALAKLRMKYGSKQSIEFMDSLMKCMFRTAVITSSKLAQKYGTFPGYKQEVLNSKIILNHFTSEELDLLGIRENGLRNCSLLSIAPAGSIGTMLDVSTGCEPAFSISYKRKTESLNSGEDKYYDVYIGVAKQYMDSHNGDKLPDYFVTAADIDWRDRIDMQSVLQKHVDTAISSTVNLKKDISVNEVEKLYLYAWEKNLKGVTIFRDGCKRTGILTTGDEETTKEAPQTLERGMIIKVDNDTIGKERHLITGCGSLHVSAFFDPDTGDLLECYLNKGSSGGCLCNLTAISRMMSLSARGGVDVYTIADQLKSVPSCPSYAVRAATKHDTSKGSSCPVAIANAIIDMYEEIQDDLFDIDEEYEPASHKVVEVSVDNELIKVPKIKNKAKCPECGGELIFEGGCQSCKDCGYSKCE